MTDSLLVPDDEPEAEPYLGDMTPVVRFGTLEEALALKGCLVAAGLPAVVGDQYQMMQGGLWMGAVGSGVRVLVPAALVARANEVLEQFRSGAFEIEGDADPDLLPPVTPTELAFWGPDLAAFLSLYLTPIFGATIHWLNSRTLGDRRLARVADIGLLLSIVATGLGFWLLREHAWGLASAFSASGIVGLYTGVWYLFGAHPQSKFIVRSFGRQYRHRKLLIPAGAVFFLMLAIGFIGQAAGLD